MEPTELALLNGFADAVVIVDSAGVVLRLSDNFNDWPGNALPLAVGDHVWRSMAPERISQRKFILSDVLATGTAARFVDRVEGRWAQIAVHRVDWRDGEQRIALVYRDIDAQVRAEEELKRLRLRVLTIQEDERRAISQNLHDELGQGMTALLMQVRALKDAPAASDELATRVQAATAQVELLTKRMRQIFYRIRPPSFADTSLVEALTDYCSASARANGLQIDVDAEPQLPTLDGSRSTALYRLLQECLTNVVKHAEARSVWVSISREGDTVCLAVEDDGRGFDPAEVKPGIGLTGVRERFQMLEGDVQVESARHRGTRVSGVLPMVTGVLEPSA